MESYYKDHIGHKNVLPRIKKLAIAFSLAATPTFLYSQENR